MVKNMGTVDRVVRVALGIALLAFALFGPADIGWKWIGFIGIVPLATSVVSFCPAYRLLGIRTCTPETAS